MYGERFELKEKNGICRAKKDMKSEMRDMHFDSLGRREREREMRYGCLREWRDWEKRETFKERKRNREMRRNKKSVIEKSNEKEEK